MNADKKNIKTSLGEGKKQQQKGNFLEAIAAYKQALELDPNSFIAYQNIGEAFAQIGKLSDAIAAYEKVISLKPNFSWSYQSLGIALSKLGNFESAISAYEKAIELNPNFPWSYYHLGTAWKEVGNFQKASAAYQKVIDLKPDSEWSYYNLGTILLQNGDREAAINAFQKAIEISPNTHNFYIPLGKVFSQMGSFDEAILCFQKAIKLNATLAENQIILGDLLKQKGLFDDAIRAYLKAIQLKPNCSESYIKVNTLIRYEPKLSSSILDDSITVFNKILQKKSESLALTRPFLARSSLAHALTQKGEIDEAISAYQRASLEKVKKWRPDISSSAWKSAKYKPPTYIIIGAEKCGTTSLYHYINQHPQCLCPIEKEIVFFDKEFDRGIDWYLAHFPPIPQEGVFVTGETSPNYLYSRQAPRRVFQFFPEIKLIVILRNPVDRTVSRYNMIVRNGWESRAFEDAVYPEIKVFDKEIKNGKVSWNFLDDNRHIGNSLYFYHIKRWLSLFHREQVFIVKSEDLYKKPDMTLKNIFSFLNISNHKISDYTAQNIGSYSSISNEAKKNLVNFFKPHTQKLENYLNIQFNWF